MIDFILRRLYAIYRKRFLDFVVQDFYSEIPRRVSNQGIEVLNERRDKVEKWLLYQSFYLQRRIASTKQGVDSLFGMLLQLKIMLHMLGKPSVDLKPMADAIDDQQKKSDDLAKDVGGVKKFLDSYPQEG